VHKGKALASLSGSSAVKDHSLDSSGPPKREGAFDSRITGGFVTNKLSAIKRRLNARLAKRQRRPSTSILAMS